MVNLRDKISESFHVKKSTSIEFVVSRTFNLIITNINSIFYNVKYRRTINILKNPTNKSIRYFKTAHENKKELARNMSEYQKSSFRSLVN